MQTTENNIPKKTLPFGGMLLVIAGVFMLLNQFVEINLGGGIFFGALGLFFILWGATNRTAGLLIPGGILSGLSVGVFLVEDAHLIAETYEGGVFLFFLAAGFALITVLAWIFTREKHRWSLVVAGILSLVGFGVLILEMPNGGTLQQIVEKAFNISQYLWPLLLVVLGLWIIIKKREA